jgi:hypothetical protein
MAATRENVVEGARSQAILKPKAERVMGATLANMDDVNRNMEGNPRLARLGNLAMAKQCRLMGTPKP